MRFLVNGAECHSETRGPHRQEIYVTATKTSSVSSFWCRLRSNLADMIFYRTMAQAVASMSCLGRVQVWIAKSGFGGKCPGTKEEPCIRLISTKSSQYSW